MNFVFLKPTDKPAALISYDLLGYGYADYIDKQMHSKILQIMEKHKTIVEVTQPQNLSNIYFGTNS